MTNHNARAHHAGKPTINYLQGCTVAPGDLEHVQITDLQAEDEILVHVQCDYGPTRRRVLSVNADHEGPYAVVASLGLPQHSEIEVQDRDLIGRFRASSAASR